MNLKKANNNGSFANAVPIAEIKNNIPIIIKVFFLPKIFVG